MESFGYDEVIDKGSGFAIKALNRFGSVTAHIKSTFRAETECIWVGIAFKLEKITQVRASFTIVVFNGAARDTGNKHISIWCKHQISWLIQPAAAWRHKRINELACLSVESLDLTRVETADIQVAIWSEIHSIRRVHPARGISRDEDVHKLPSSAIKPVNSLRLAARDIQISVRPNGDRGWAIEPMS